MEKLVKLQDNERTVFVGDTHAQYDITRRIFDKYLDSNTTIVFLGDYIDGGKRSKDNVDLIVDTQKTHSNQIIMLQGNHEGYRHQPFRGTKFWREIEEDDFPYYRQLFDNLPLAASVGDIIATHSGLPNVTNLEEINNIENGDENWKNTVWGDFTEHPYAPYHELRPTLSESYFDNVMKRIGKKLLIRSHDPRPPLSMFMGRCVTLKTNRIKDVAIADYSQGKPIQNLSDLKIEIV